MKSIIFPAIFLAVTAFADQITCVDANYEDKASKYNQLQNQYDSNMNEQESIDEQNIKTNKVNQLAAKKQILEKNKEAVSMLQEQEKLLKFAIKNCIDDNEKKNEVSSILIDLKKEINSGKRMNLFLEEYLAPDNFSKITCDDYKRNEYSKRFKMFYSIQDIETQLNKLSDDAANGTISKEEHQDKSIALYTQKGFLMGKYAELSKFYIDSCKEFKGSPKSEALEEFKAAKNYADVLVKEDISIIKEYKVEEQK